MLKLTAPSGTAVHIYPSPTLRLVWLAPPFSLTHIYPDPAETDQRAMLKLSDFNSNALTYWPLSSIQSFAVHKAFPSLLDCALACACAFRPLLKTLPKPPRQQDALTNRQYQQVHSICQHWQLLEWLKARHCPCKPLLLLQRISSDKNSLCGAQKTLANSLFAVQHNHKHEPIVVQMH